MLGNRKRSAALFVELPSRLIPTFLAGIMTETDHGH